MSHLMTTLLLVRHGRTSWNSDRRVQGQIDVPLDEVGEQQAQCIAERMRSLPITAIYTSPLQRAQATAKVIAAQLNLPIHCDDRLMEYNFGVISGLTSDEIEAQYPQLARHWADEVWAVPIEGSEGRENFGVRVTTVMNDIIARHPGEQVAVIAHGGTFSVYLAKVLGLDLKRRQPFHFGNTSLSSVEMRNGVFSIRFLNDTCHLQNGNKSTQGETLE